MRLVILALLATLAAPAFAGDPEVDTGGILRLVGRFSMGSACPVLTEGHHAGVYALTNAHNTDLRPFDDVPLYPYRWQNNYGDSGVAFPQSVFTSHDLSWVRLTPPPRMVYTIAANRPSPGDRVYWSEFNFKSRKKAMAPVYRKAKVLRTVAGHIVIDKTPNPGASGSCVLNEAGEVVGIIAFAVRVGDTSHVGLAVGVWGDWEPELPKSAEEE